MKIIGLLAGYLLVATAPSPTPVAPHHCGCGNYFPDAPPANGNPGDARGNTRSGSGESGNPLRGTGSLSDNDQGRLPSEDPSEDPWTRQSPPSDVTGWEMWWGFNCSPYLDLKRRVLEGDPETRGDDFYLGHGTRRRVVTREVTDDDLCTKAGPALQAAIESDPDNSVRAAALVALAKLHPLYMPEGGGSMFELIAGHLSHSDHAVREAAIVALGLLGEADSAIFLCEIAADRELGRDLLGREKVSRSTRARAALALGLAGSRCPRLEVRTYIVHHLARILETDESASPDLGVACVTSIGLMPLADAPQALEAEELETLPPSTSRETQIRFLCEVLENLRVCEIVRAHVPRALGRLVTGVDDPQKDVVARAMLDQLTGKRKVDRLVRHGLVFGLGMIGDADRDPIDVAIRQALCKAAHDSHAMQQQLSMVSLALVSGRPGRGLGSAFAGNRDACAHLLKHLARGKSRVRPWAALALGLKGHHELEAGATVSADTTTALRQRLADTRAPSDVGAICLALGLVRDTEAVPALLETLETTNEEIARGSAAVGLGLLGAREAVPTLRAILADSRHRPGLLQDVAISLALLGDKSAVDTLLEIMRDSGTCYTLSAVVNALAYVGDERTLDPLVAMLGNQERSVGSRRTAAVALGVVCERDLLPWTSLFTNDLNYTASTTTLISSDGEGLLNQR